MSWLRISYLHDLYGEVKKQKDPDPFPPSKILYWHPGWPEYIELPSRVLKRLLKKKLGFIKTVEQAVSKGYPLSFKGYEYPRSQEGEMFFPCTHYSGRVHPAICLGRRLIWPKRLIDPVKLSQERESLQIQIEGASNIGIIQKLRKELEKLQAFYDPYPNCRRCKMGKRFEEESCLGVEFNPKDFECRVCLDSTECCHLLRLRVRRILDDREEEVIRELEEELAIMPREMMKQKFKEKIMARKKKTEEEEEPIKKKKKRKTEEEEPIKKKKRREPEEASPKKKKKKKGKKSAEDIEIDELLDELEEAKENDDASLCSRIRGKLRARGYFLSSMKED